jgi:hypothetical protein
VVAPEFRIFQLLRAHYSALRQMRALDFGVVPEEGLEQRRRKKEKEKGNVVEKAPELIDEAAFNDIYAQVVAGRSAAPAQQWGTPPAYPPPPSLPPPQLQQAAPSWSSVPARPPPPMIAPVAPPAPAVVQPAPPAEERRAQPRAPPPQPAAWEMTPPQPQQPIEKLPEDAILEELPLEAIVGEAEAEPPLRTVTWDDEPAPPAAPARDESPLEFKAALKALEGVTDRDSIAHIVLRASRSKAARALLLHVQGGVAVGWDGLGEGLENGAARAVAIPLSLESAFSLVVKSRSHYMGPLQKTPLNIRFLAMLGKKVPLSSLLFPILHRGRVSHMLYLDNGHKQQAPTDVGEMLILSQRISQTVEALVERKRKAARG